ncbi:phosphoribosylamine--glycine ligase, partial [Bacteroidales bacterium OttesenSCG-928-K03]|nr:phosphoribosylamine--glycine ligase [Bacteroidales bacterium OttesenSCG-928-K03]
MNVLLLGSGGREHAIAYKIAQSKLLDNLFIAPGNGGTNFLGKNTNLDVADFDAISKFINDQNINMLVVGPEIPLAEGITDFLAPIHKELMIIGPSQQGAMLESSKEFSKQFMIKHKIPTAQYKSFSKAILNDGYNFLETLKPPYVLKADGLAAGKGVIIAETLEEAKLSLKEMLEDEKFGKSSERVVVEEFLHGIELSVFVITDGENYLMLPEAKDYKRIGEGDTGLNTGGMGSVSPVPFANHEFMQKVEEKVILPTIKGLQKENIDYTGFIFFGLMNCNGEPYVIEYNCRMGDPETESVFPRIKSDILEIFTAAAKKQLDYTRIEIDTRTVATVMLVSNGYPNSYNKGMEINIENNAGLIFHAGTKIDEKGNLIANGGRVITATAFGNSVSDAFENAYNLADKINFDNKYLRY